MTGRPPQSDGEAPAADARLNELIDSAVRADLVRPALHPDTPPYDPGKADALLRRFEAEGLYEAAGTTGKLDRLRRLRWPLALAASLGALGFARLLNVSTINRPTEEVVQWRGAAAPSRVFDPAPERASTQLAQQLRQLGAHVQQVASEGGWRLQIDASALDLSGKAAVAQALSALEVTLPADGRLEMMVMPTPG